MKRDEIEATHDLEYALKNSDISFICVGTQTNELKGIRRVAEGIGEVLKTYQKRPTLGTSHHNA